MLVINLLCWLVVIGVPLYGIYRGGGSLLFVGLLITLAGFLLQKLQPLLVVLLGEQQPATGYDILLALFLCACIAAFPLGTRINRIVQLSLDPFDFVLGAVFGLAAAVASMHFSLVFLLMAVAGTPEHARLIHTSAVHQLVHFAFWHAISNYVIGLRLE